MTVRRICLSGTWRATEQIGLQPRAGRPEFADHAWAQVPVPGHWQDTPALAGATRVLYRRTFTLAGAPAPGAAWRLRLDGVCYRAAAWVNGRYAGQHEGYFLPAVLDVTRHLVAGENVLVVEVECAREPDRRPRRQVLGVFGGWEAGAPGCNPGGLWRDVWLEEYTDGVVPGLLRVCAEPLALPLPPGAAAPAGADPKDYAPPGAPLPGVVTAEAEFWCAAPGRLAWAARLDLLPRAGLAGVTGAPPGEAGAGGATPGDAGPGGAGSGAAGGRPPAAHAAGEHAHGKGLRRLSVVLRPEDVRLWWTWDHGRPDLYRFTLTLHPEGGTPLVLERTLGFRRVRLARGRLELNGRSVFLRGTNLGPPDRRPADCTPARYAADLAAAAAANLNTVRLHGHVAAPECYAEADRLGLLVWQDFPLYGPCARDVLPQARRQAAAMAEELGHHPCIGLWCGHSRPHPVRRPGTAAAVGAAAGRLGALAAALDPTTLDAAVARAIRQHDRTRPVLRHAGDPGLFGVGASASIHLFVGWTHGGLPDLPALLRRDPRAGRLVAAYGAQAFPVVENTRRLAPGAWPDLHWQALADRHLLQPGPMERCVPRARAGSLEEYVAQTQAYQTTLVKHHTEVLRARKYHPCAAALQFLLADGCPGVTWAVLDYWRAPKPAYAELARANTPAYVLAEWPAPAYSPGRTAALAVTLVNDLWQPLRGRWGWTVQRAGAVLGQGGAPCDLPPDSVTAVPGVRWPVPPDLAPGPVDLVLTLDLDGLPPVQNPYVLTVDRGT